MRRRLAERSAARFGTAVVGRLLLVPVSCAGPREDAAPEASTREPSSSSTRQGASGRRRGAAGRAGTATGAFPYEARQELEGKRLVMETTDLTLPLFYDVASADMLP